MQSGYMLMILVSHGTFHARCVSKCSGDVKKVVYKKGNVMLRRRTLDMMQQGQHCPISLSKRAQRELRGFAVY